MAEETPDKFFGRREVPSLRYERNKGGGGGLVGGGLQCDGRKEGGREGGERRGEVLRKEDLRCWFFSASSILGEQTWLKERRMS